MTFKNIQTKRETTAGYLCQDKNQIYQNIPGAPAGVRDTVKKKTTLLLISHQF